MINSSLACVLYLIPVQIINRRKFPSQCSISPEVYRGLLLGQGTEEGQGAIHEAGREPLGQTVPSGAFSLHNDVILATGAESSGPPLFLGASPLNTVTGQAHMLAWALERHWDFGFYLSFELTPVKSNDFSNPTTIHAPVSTNVTSASPDTRFFKLILSSSVSTLTINPI